MTGTLLDIIWRKTTYFFRDNQRFPTQVLVSVEQFDTLKRTVPWDQVERLVQDHMLWDLKVIVVHGDHMPPWNDRQIDVRGDA